MASAVFQQPTEIEIVGVLATSLIIAATLLTVIGKRIDLKSQALLVVFSISFALPFAMSFYRQEAFVWYRHPVILFPMFCLILGGALSQQKNRKVVQFLIVILVLIGAAGTVRYFSWSKSNVRDVAEYADLITQDSVKLIIRPANFAPLLNYYYHGDARQLDETYLDQPLGRIVDTARSFVYISLDVPNDIRTYMDSHFMKIRERKFPGEAHMGMIVGVYSQKERQLKIQN